MERTLSADGTAIAYDGVGEGRPVVIVNGAFSTSGDAREIAARLAEHDLMAIIYDRRARGESGDTAPYAPAREIDDLLAVIDAVGGEAAVLGHSSGAVLSLLAAASEQGGRRIRHLFLSEPPFRFGVDEPPADLAARMQSSIDEGRPGHAVTAFQLEGVGLPAEAVEQIRQSPIFEHLLPLAQSTVYDQTLVSSVSTPTPGMLAVTVPVTVLRGERTFPMLITAADRLAATLPGAELVVSPESVDHRLDPGAAARIVGERLGS
ncbi:alpha/beta fold hydrolase [Frondihabitans australicus]|uniref:Alpha-beta hydrolase superfamily lysophospholipase n=1 Tax=Frondihabitans australicus TaxID=386892 RepID=A0A495IK29_9MICO|nr:alpha/beta fold hydrolase [Frondihabitans australicus]RKR76080.1 alpha-beta hydrolase superfamily lysophospholipase [Frondihabitans australicus]